MHSHHTQPIHKNLYRYKLLVFDPRKVVLKISYLYVHTPFHQNSQNTANLAHHTLLQVTISTLLLLFAFRLHTSNSLHRAHNTFRPREPSWIFADRACGFDTCIWVAPDAVFGRG
jgi:hypothetical protein